MKSKTKTRNLQDKHLTGRAIDAMTPAQRQKIIHEIEESGEGLTLDVFKKEYCALLSAYFGLGVGPGDEVICPTYTWICSIGPALLLGARPVFCESDPTTMLLDPSDVRRRITTKTKGIIAVHLYGHPAPMTELMQLAREHDLKVIEDCAQAHGATIDGRSVGEPKPKLQVLYEGVQVISAVEAHSEFRTEMVFEVLKQRMRKTNPCRVAQRVVGRIEICAVVIVRHHVDRGNVALADVNDEVSGLRVRFLIGEIGREVHPAFTEFGAERQ